MHPSTWRLYPRLDIHPQLAFPGSAPGPVTVYMPTAHREPLCTVTALPLPPCARGTGRWELPRLRRSYGLMRHTIILPSASVSLVLQVFAGCCEPLLHDGASRRYLCDPCTVAWVRTPPRSSSALVRFFPLDIGLSLGSTKSARETVLQHSFTQGEISGLQPFAYVQASVLAWPPDCSDRTDFCQFGLVAVYTGQYL